MFCLTSLCTGALFLLLSAGVGGGHTSGSYPLSSWGMMKSSRGPSRGPPRGRADGTGSDILKLARTAEMSLTCSYSTFIWVRTWDHFCFRSFSCTDVSSFWIWDNLRDYIKNRFSLNLKIDIVMQCINNLSNQQPREFKIKTDRILKINLL